MLGSGVVGIFARLEALLEHLVEAPAARLGASLQPATLSKRIERAMDAGKVFRDGGAIVPNHYRLHLHPADAARFAPYQASLQDDLAHDVLSRSRREDYRLMARPRVELVADGAVPRGDVRVAASVEDAGTLPEARPSSDGPGRDTMVFAGASASAGGSAPTARAWLVVQTAGGPATRFELDGALIGVGRGPDNDVIIDDPQVSRHHCQLRRVHGAYGFVDLGSRNGSTVNGVAATEVALGAGDVIRIGQTTIEFQVHG